MQIANETELKDAIKAGADIVVLDDLRLVAIAKELSESVVVECTGKITPENVREYADAGAQMISIESLTNAPAMDITFKVQPF